MDHILTSIQTFFPKARSILRHNVDFDTIIIEFTLASGGIYEATVNKVNSKLTVYKRGKKVLDAITLLGNSLFINNFILKSEKVEEQNLFDEFHINACDRIKPPLYIANRGKKFFIRSAFNKNIVNMSSTFNSFSINEPKLSFNYANEEVLNIKYESVHDIPTFVTSDYLKKLIEKLIPAILSSYWDQCDLKEPVDYDIVRKVSDSHAIFNFEAPIYINNLYNGSNVEENPHAEARDPVYILSKIMDRFPNLQQEFNTNTKGVVYRQDESNWKKCHNFEVSARLYQLIENNFTNNDFDVYFALNHVDSITRIFKFKMAKFVKPIPTIDEIAHSNQEKFKLFISQVLETSTDRSEFCSIHDLKRFLIQYTFDDVLKRLDWVTIVKKLLTNESIKVLNRVNWKTKTNKMDQRRHVLSNYKLKSL